MDELIQFVARNGYLVVFVGVLIEQIGIPLPSNLLLIVAGALAGLGQLEFEPCYLIDCLGGVARQYCLVLHRAETWFSSYGFFMQNFA